MRMRVLVDLHLYLTDGDADATSNGAAVRQVQMAERVFPIIAANDLNIGQTRSFTDGWRSENKIKPTTKSARSKIS